MGKLKLNLDDIKVESFEATSTISQAGTVNGQNLETEGGGETCNYMCDTEQNNSCGITCGLCTVRGTTCDGTCDVTCPATCAAGATCWEFTCGNYNTCNGNPSCAICNWPNPF